MKIDDAVTYVPQRSVTPGVLKALKYAPHVIVGGLALKSVNDIFNNTIGIRHGIAEGRKKEQLESSYDVLKDIRGELRTMNMEKKASGASMVVASVKKNPNNIGRARKILEGARKRRMLVLSPTDIMNPANPSSKVKRFQAAQVAQKQVSHIGMDIARGIK